MLKLVKLHCAVRCDLHVPCNPDLRIFKTLKVFLYHKPGQQDPWKAPLVQSAVTYVSLHWISWWNVQYIIYVFSWPSCILGTPMPTHEAVTACIARKHTRTRIEEDLINFPKWLTKPKLVLLLWLLI